MSPEPPPSLVTTRAVDRYVLHDEIAAGGMATVHLGRLRGAVGFSRTVAIKRLHARFARDHEFVAMFLDEARLAARIRHPHVVSTLDVVSSGDELFLVMDYVPGETLSRAMRAALDRGERVPPSIAVAVVVGTLHGLHAAHEAKDERGRPLDVVHRDVSPQNILVGADGIARVLDFGIAKAAGRLHQTRDGQLKGKLAYMAPEQFHNKDATRSVDVYAASVVLWEALTGRRLFAGENEAALVERVLYGRVESASEIVAGLPPEIDRVLARGLSREPAERFSTARELAVATEQCIGPASADEIAAWLEGVASPALRQRAAMVTAIECADDVPAPRPSAPAAPVPPQSSLEATAATMTSPSAHADGTPSSSLTAGAEPVARRRAPLMLAAGLSLAVAVAAAVLLGRPSPSAPASTPSASLAASADEVTIAPTPTAPLSPSSTSSPTPPPPASAAAPRPGRAAAKVGPTAGTATANGRGKLPAGLPDRRD